MLIGFHFPVIAWFQVVRLCRVLHPEQVKRQSTSRLIFCMAAFDDNEKRKIRLQGRNTILDSAFRPRVVRTQRVRGVDGGHDLDVFHIDAAARPQMRPRNTITTLHT